jgi:hypothetical protein
MRKEIGLNEMRERVARLIYGKDWIGSLTDEQYELLRAHAPAPRAVVRTDGSTIRLGHVERCPSTLAAKLDRAIGRQARMDAQFVTVDSWIQDHGFLERVADRAQFNRAIRKEGPAKKSTTLARRGPKPKILPRVIAEMQADLEKGSLILDALKQLPQKELASRYSASRETTEKARATVVATARK